MKLLLCLIALSSPALADTQNISGWTVHVNDNVDAAALKTALPLLKAQLEEIKRVVPAAAVIELQKVPLWISPEYPGTPPRAEYHPGADWLREHGRDPAMAKAVELLMQLQLPVKPASTHAVRAQPGCGRLVPRRKNTTVSAHPTAMMAYGLTRLPIAPTAIRPSAIAAEKSKSPVPAMAGENPSDSSA